MNYFLHYSNSVPLFIGGEAHGSKRAVPLDYRHFTVALFKPFEPSLYRHNPGVTDSSVKTETYRREIFAAGDRRFHVFIHDCLDTSAALMLMMRTVSESPALKARVKDLEEEVKALKAIIKAMKGELWK